MDQIKNKENCSLSLRRDLRLVHLNDLIDHLIPRLVVHIDFEKVTRDYSRRHNVFCIRCVYFMSYCAMF